MNVNAATGRTVRVLIIALTAVVLLTGCNPPSPSTGSDGSMSPMSPMRPSASTPARSGSASPATPGVCASGWGTDARTDEAVAATVIVGVRAGRHPCFDRLVVDLDGEATGFDVAYVPALVGVARDDEIPLRGTAVLRIVILAPGYDPDTGAATVSITDPEELVDVDGFASFRQVAWGGSFEARTVIGIGVTQQRPFRVFTLAGPGDGSRIVIDIAS